MTYNIGTVEQHREVLGLVPPFSETDLKATYRRLMMRWHPDRHLSSAAAHREATEKAKLINVAFEYISEYLEQVGGIYRDPVNLQPRPAERSIWSEPRRRYEGKPYTPGFPNAAVTEIFVKSSHIVSTGYDRTRQILYIKFSGGVIYRYFSVPEKIFDSFLKATSYGKFAHSNIYQQYRQERC